MSSIIYIRNDGDDFTPEQFELLHKYSDQALVWAHLFLKAEFIRDSNRWREIRQQMIDTKKALAEIDPKYAEAVEAAIKKIYIDSSSFKQIIRTFQEKVRAIKTEDLNPDKKQEEIKAAEAARDAAVATLNSPFFTVGKDKWNALDDSKDASHAVIPPYDTFPSSKNKTPQDLQKIHDLVEKFRQVMTDLYPAQFKPRFMGAIPDPKSPDDPKSLLPDPFLPKEDLEKVLTDPVGLQEYVGPEGELPPINMAQGWAKNHGIPPSDIENFARDAVEAALKLYNPYRTEDTGVGRGGKQASFGTLLFEILRSRASARKSKTKVEISRTCPECHREVGRKDAACPWCNYDFTGGKKPISLKVDKELSLDQPVSEESGKTVEDFLQEEGVKVGIDWEAYVEPLRAWLTEKVQRPGSRFPQKSADIILDVFKRKFINGEKLSEIATSGTTESGTEYSYVVDRPRQKEIQVLRDLGVDVSSLPEKLPGGVYTEDKIARQHMWVDFFKNLNETIEVLKKKENKTPEETKELESLEQKREKAQVELDALKAPDVAKVHNMMWGHPRHKSPFIMEFLYQYDELKPLIENARSKFKQSALEELLSIISRLRVEGELNYNLLRNKIQQKLTDINPQLFSVYTYLYENDFSNPDTARIMKLSPPRITGLKKKIISSLFELPEIQNLLDESDIEADSISPLRRFLFKQGDVVKVSSINEIGSIQEIYKNDWFKVHLNNGNDVLTIKDDIQKFCTLINSANAVVDHYFGRDVITGQCYLALTEEALPKLAILELRPISTSKTGVRLYINNNLIDITEISEKYPDNLYSILKGHIGVTAKLDTPFTPLFEQIEDKTAKLDKKLLKEVEQMDTEEQASLRKMFFQEFYNSLTIDQKKEWQEISAARHKKDPKREEMWQSLWAKLDEKQKAAFREYHQLQGHTQTDIEYRKRREQEKDKREREQAPQPSPADLLKIRDQVMEEQFELRKKSQDNGQERI